MLHEKNCFDMLKMLSFSLNLKLFFPIQSKFWKLQVPLSCYFCSTPSPPKKIFAILVNKIALQKSKGKFGLTNKIRAMPVMYLVTISKLPSKMFLSRLFFPVSLQFPLIISNCYLSLHIIVISFPLPSLASSKTQMTDLLCPLWLSCMFTSL